MLLTESQTGYPSIDKPWLKYYREEAIQSSLPQKTMYEFLWENNKDNLSDTALRYYGRKITYSKLINGIKSAVMALHEMGIKRGDIITVMSMHTPETIYLIYAINYIGAISNVVYMTLSENEIVNTLENTDSKAFFVLEPAVERVQKIKDKISIPIIVLPIADSMPVYLRLLLSLKANKNNDFIRYKEFIASGHKSSLPLMNKDHEAVAAIVYTSGTTGEPKGVMLSNDALNAIVWQDLNGIIGFQRKLTFLFMLPPFIGYGFAHLHVALCAGLDLQLQIDLTPEKIANELFKNKYNCFCAGPAFVDAIMSHGVSNLDNLLYFICGGGEITKEKEIEVNAFLKKCNSTASYSNGYGMTEASSVLCANCNSISKLSSLGIPFIKTNVKVVDLETGQELGYGEQGELCFNSPSLMAGYFKKPDETNKVIKCDSEGAKWLHTGDIGFVDKDGFIFMSGRIKRIFYARAGLGEICRVFPSSIEETIEKSPVVSTCAVTVRDDSVQISVPIAYVTLANDTKGRDRAEIVGELFDLAKKELPQHMQPEKINILDKMPMTQGGKIDYHTLEQLTTSEK